MAIRERQRTVTPPVDNALFSQFEDWFKQQRKQFLPDVVDLTSDQAFLKQPRYPTTVKKATLITHKDFFGGVDNQEESVAHTGSVGPRDGIARLCPGPFRRLPRLSPF